MATRRISSSNYLGVGLAIATGAVVNLSWSPQASAQVQDLNLPAQMNITAPPPVVAPPSAEIVSDNFVTFLSGTNQGACKSITSPEVLQLALDVDRYQSLFASANTKGLFRAGMSDAEKIEFLLRHPEKVKEILRPLAGTSNNANNEANRPLVAFPPQTNIKFGCNAQPTVVKVSFPFNPTSETNVLKSGNNSSPGGSAGFGGNVLATTAGLRPLDLVALSAGEGSSRYDPHPTSSNDTATSYIAYQYFLGAEGYVNGKMIPIDEHSQNAPKQNLITIDTLAFGFQNQTSFTPTFHAEKADLFTPQFTLSRQNIGLDDPKRTDCALADAFCRYLSLSLTVGESLSDVAIQQNFNVAVSATPGWRIDDTLTLSLPATMTARDYQHFVGGRRDLQLQVGPMLMYTPANKLFTFSLPVSYYKNYSSVTAAEWSGLVIQPTLTIAFCTGC
jgi:hypothetical protein